MKHSNILVFILQLANQIKRDHRINMRNVLPNELIFRTNEA